jgi:DNA polymerase III epsilon subunit-like protein
MPVPSDAKLVAYDIETSRSHSGECEIVQFGAVFEDASFMRLVKPKLPINPDDRGNSVHGITDEDVKDAPGFAEFFGNFLSWLEERVGSSPVVLMGYNNWTSDDKKLAAELKVFGGRPFGLRQVFTTDVYRAVVASEKGKRDKLKCKSLSAMYQLHVGGSLEGAHDAAVDAAATLDVSKHYWRHLEARPFEDASVPVLKCNRVSENS